MNSGGKGAAPTIQSDEDWRKLSNDLARHPYNRVVDVSVTLDTDILFRRFERVQLVSLSICSGSVTHVS